MRPAAHGCRMGMLAAVERILCSSYFPMVPQIASVVAFVAILFFSFAGNPHGETNLAVAVTWSVWWALLPFSAVVLGRVWCSFCPISTISRTLLSFRNRSRRLDRTSSLRHGGWLSGVLLLALSWAIIVWRIDEMPVATGLLLLAFTASAIVVGLLFSERTWCKTLCPIGTIIGLYSRLAPLQLRPTGTTCAAKCGRTGRCHAALTSHQCLHEGPVSGLGSNRNCSLCGYCLKSCRHSSVELRVGLPEAVTTRAPGMTGAEAAVLMLLLALVLMDLLRMTPWYPTMMKQLVGAGSTLDYNVVLVLAIVALAACLQALYLLAAWVSAVVAGRTLREAFLLFSLPYIAVAAAVHLGSEIFHLANHGTMPLLAVALELGFAVDFPAVVRGARYTQDATLQVLEIALLLIATALAVGAFWKASASTGTGGLRRGVSAGLPATLSIIIAAAAAFLFISPMGMIH
ncbi:MAG: 4Fe-4S binding protein [Chloroflexi bacterium]|nr:4Fe-4S binding protein [Chloroflexota bacterium]